MRDNTQEDIDFFYAQSDPFFLFDAWFSLASCHEIHDPHAMSLATVSSVGIPDVRIVFLKQHDVNGFVFFTNYHSQKAEDIFYHSYVSLGFYWKSLQRQVRIKGKSVRTSEAVSDAYFASRSRDSQLGAWSSLQSQPLEERDIFLKRLEDTKKRFAGKDVARPPHWGGYRVVPQQMEFWIAHEHRLHERCVFEKRIDSDVWDKTLLYP